MKHLPIAPLLVLILSAGCQSVGTLLIEENHGILQPLRRISPPPVQDGPIGYGFNSSQVYQALGAPNRETVVATTEGLLETWIYIRPLGILVLELLDGDVVSIRGEP